MADHLKNPGELAAKCWRAWSLPFLFVTCLASLVLAVGCDGGTPTEPAELPEEALSDFDPGMVVADSAGNHLVVNQLLVSFEPGTEPDDAIELISSVGGEVIGFFGPPDTYQAEFSIASLSALQGIVDELASDSRTLAVLKAYFIPIVGRTDNDALGEDVGWAYRRVRLSDAWRLIEKAQSEQSLELSPVTIGVVDDGIYGTHAEFDGVTVKVVDLSFTHGLQPEPRGQHGTSVAGVIGAENGKGGMNGILGPAGDQYEMVVYETQACWPSLRGAGVDCGLWAPAVVLGVISAALVERVDVVNMSFGLDIPEWSGYTLLIRWAMRRVPMAVFVAGAGNSGEDVVTAWPIQEPNLVKVVATDVGDNRSVWPRGLCHPEWEGESNFGSGTLAAPGTHVWTARAGDGHRAFCGTSAAAPIISGVAGLVRMLGGEVSGSAEEVIALLFETADEISTDRGAWKRVNACRAVAGVLGVRCDTVWVSLSADPTSGGVPLTTELRAQVGGTATGTVNYTFWWDCDDPGVSVQDVAAVCGDPTDALIGAKFNTETVTTKTVGHTYDAPGTYNAKVIVERGSATPVEDQTVITAGTPAELAFATVSAGNGHTCAVTTDGTGLCWGNNGLGELGNGSTHSETTPDSVVGGLVFLSVSADGSHSCGLTTDGTAYCWGWNYWGQLGNGTTGGSSSVPVPVSGGLRFNVVSAGDDYTCGLATDSTAYCWGVNLNGQLGDGSTTSRSVPVPVTDGLRFASVSAGGSHTCGITGAGRAYCWGRGGSGELGNGEREGSATPVPVSGGITFMSVDAGGSHTCGVGNDGVAYCWGAGSFGQLGDGASLRRTTPVPVAGGLRFRSVSGGGYHTCGVTTGYVAVCWGYNGRGQLGDGSTTSHSSPTAVSGALMFESLSVGGFIGGHTCGIVTPDIAYCWGAGGYGQLGNGVTEDQHVPVPVLGQR